jgi:hypothetical protein
MDLTQLANLGEFIGGAAVLVTLIYLALQVRQGNQARTRDTYRAFVTEMNRVLFTPMTDPETMLLLQKGARDFEALNRCEQGVISAVWSPLFILFGENYSARKHGSIDPLMSHQLDVIVASFLQMPGLAAWWNHVKPYWDPEFSAHLESLLSSPDCPPPTHEMLPWYMPEGVIAEAVQ